MRCAGEYKSFRASAAAALRRALPGRAWLATAFGIAVAAASVPSAVSIVVPVPAGVAGGVMQAMPLRAAAPAKKPGAIATAENEAYSRVQVNDSFGAMDLLRQARRLLRSGHIAHALNAYQKAIDRYGNKVVRVQHGQYVTVSDEVSRLILSLPESQLAVYNQLFGPQAGKAIAAAEAAGDLDALLQADARYFPSEAAAAGISAAAQQSFERGYFSQASRLWASLLAHPAAANVRPMLLYKAALAAHLAGDEQAAASWQRQLQQQYPAAQGKLFGKMVALAPSLAAVLAQPRWSRAAATGDRWRTFGGNNRRNRILKVASLPGATIWTEPINSLAMPQQMSNNLTPFQRQSLQQAVTAFSGGVVAYNQFNQTQTLKLPTILYDFPTYQNGTVYLHMIDQIEAVNAASGYMQWRYPASNPDQANRLAQNLNLLAAGLNHLSCTLQGNRVLAVLPTHSQGGTPIQYYWMMATPANRLVCLDATNGDLQWTVNSRDLAPSQPRGVSLSFITSPLTDSHAVYLLARASGGAAQPMQLYLIKLKLSDGSLIWRHYLCTIAHAGYSVGTLDVLTAMAGGEIYIATGKGADMAVDATLGRILWLHLTPSDHTPQQAVYWGQMKRTPPWQLNAPIVADGRLIAADSGQPTNGTIRIYNRWTGQLLQTLLCSKLSAARITAGVLNHQLILVGHRAVGVNIDSGTVAWRSPEISRFGKLAGRPMLSQNSLYVPLTTGLLLVSATGGPAAPKLIAWPAGLHNQPGQPGNILVTRQEVLVVGDTFASGLARWQTALAYNQARIDKHPDAVEPRLTLAEIAFRTQHYNMSQQLMQQAANLAISQGQQTLLYRIFRISLDFGHRLGKAAATQPRARFYLTIAQQTARAPQQQVQWRMETALLDLRTGQVASAILLLQQMLSSDAYRQAPLRLANATMLAGIAAEAAIAHALATPAGRTAYQTFEDQAQQQLLAAGNGDGQPLAAIMRRYPNSHAAMNAAWRLATMQTASAHWRAASRTLYWLQRRAAGQVQARVLAQLARCARHLGRWNLALQLAQRGLREYPTFDAAIAGRSVNFAGLVSTLISQAPAGALVHLPQLNWTLHSGFTILTPVSGSLMRPIETSPRFQRGDMFMVQQVQGQVTSILAMNSQTGEELWHYRLRQMVHAALMGYVGQTAVFITSSRAFALDAATGKELWSHSLVQQAKNLHLPNRIMAPQVFIGGGPIFINNQFIQQQMSGNGAYLANQMARRRQQRLVQALGAATFADVRLTRSRLLVLGPQQVSAISISTGQPAWLKPLSLAHWGIPQHLVAAANRIVVFIGLPADTLVILKPSDGKLAGVIHLPSGDPAYWAKVGTGGTLYAAGLHGVLAYDLQGGLEAPLWYRRHMTTLLPGASQLTQDGVIVVHGSRLECLNRQDGRTRWRTTVAGLSTAPGITVPSYTLLNQDTIIVRNNNNVMAFATGSGHVRWRVNFAGQTPPVQSMRLADPDLAILGRGPLGTAQSAVKLFLAKQTDSTGRLDNGSLVLVKRLVRSAGDPNGPDIARWDVVNNGLVFEVDSSVLVFHQQNAK